MEAWEYETEVLRNEDLPLRLNVRGEVGWEFVSVTSHKMVKATFGWTTPQRSTLPSTSAASRRI